MRILAVGNMYPPHSLGGYEVIWASCTDHLRRGGHEVRILTTDFRNPQVAQDDEPEVFRELRWYWREHELPSFPLHQVARLEAHNNRVMRRHLRNFRPDAVAWWSMGGMSLSLIERCRLDGLPSVSVVCDDWVVYATQVDRWICFAREHRRPARALGRLLQVPPWVDLGSVRGWLFISDYMRQRAELMAGAPLAGTEVAHAGIDPKRFAPAEERDWQWRLLYVGRVEERKGVDTIVDALAGLPEASLKVVGEGDPSYVRRLRAAASQAGLDGRVEFVHGMDHSELGQVYRDADALAFPVRWEEPWGLVPIEAMACGLPVVATGTGGSAEYLRDGDNCLLFPPGDPDALGRALRQLADDPGLRRRLRSSGLATAAGLTDERFNEQVRAALERHVNGSRRTRA